MAFSLLKVTVDAFQGAEKEVIIMTTSRTDRRGFIDDPNRLNVSLTRYF
jgi:superfamily I DNA and/or RNA helicase